MKKLITTNKKKKACLILTNWSTPSTEYNKNHDNSYHDLNKWRGAHSHKRKKLVNRKNRNKIQLTTNS